jgi:hypothetical protein
MIPTAFSVNRFQARKSPISSAFISFVFNWLQRYGGAFVVHKTAGCGYVVVLSWLRRARMP